MRFLIVLSGSLRANSTIAFSDLSLCPTEQQIERLEQVQQAVWRITHRISTGTAFFVSPNHVVTNWYVTHDQDISSLSLQREGSEGGCL